MTAFVKAPTELEIRPATWNDAPAILRMWMALQQLDDSYPPAAFGAPDLDAQRDRLATTLNNSLDNETVLVLVARQNDQAIGTLTCVLTDRRGYQHKDTAYLISTWVEPGCRRQRIAQRMLDIARQWARLHGACSLQVGWHPANPYASAFWHAQGFRGYEVLGAMELTEDN